MEIETYALFPSLVTEVKCVAFNTIQNDLIEWIYNYQSKNLDTGVSFSNKGGWQSKSDFYKFEKSFEPFLDYILTHIGSAIKNYLNCKFKLNNMWININNKNDYNVSHTHPGVDLSGVIWIKIPEKSGNFIFESPNSFVEYFLHQNIKKDIANKYKISPSYIIPPNEGTLILFSPYLSHRVDQNLSDCDRISIAFNLDINHG